MAWWVRRRAAGGVTRRAALPGVAAILGMGAGLLAAPSKSALAANPTPPFTQCPALGVDTSCAILIVIQPDGSLTILSNPSQKPFDKSDDTLLGVQNNSGITVPSIAIGSSTQNVFGFEGDGLCAFVFTGSGYCKATPKPPTGYEGPDTKFSNISANKKDGTVNFTDIGGGLAAAQTTYFSLENAIAASNLGTGSVTSLMFTPTSATTGDHADPATVAATLMVGAAAVPNATVTFTLAPGSKSVSCTGTTNASGVASCALTPDEPAGAYEVTAAYAGSSVPFLAPVNANAPFMVTLEQDALTYTGPTSGTIGQPLVLSGVMTTDDPSAGAALGGKTVKLTLGSGANAQTCNGLTNASGVASCIVTVSASQTPGNVAASAAFVSDGFYDPAASAATVNLIASAALVTPEVGVAGVLLVPAILLILTGGCVAAGAGRRRRSR